MKESADPEGEKEMSGLAAVFSKTASREEAERLVHGMLQRMAHRGGADSSVRSFECGSRRKVISMGCRLSPGAARRGEPVSHSEGNRLLLFDGWLSSGAELFEEVRRALPRGTACSDTAAALGAYLSWGEGFLPRLKGTWALLLADFQEGVLLGAVDRWGARPLYCWEGPDGLFFASEIKGFTGHPAWKPVLERQSAYEFLNWGISDHSERTFFKGVFRFPPGELVRFGFDASSWKDRQRRRWFDPALGGFTGDFAEAAEEFGALFKRSVARRMKGERPGFAISGGLDSSSVACTAARLDRQTQLEGFFVRTPFPGHDETVHAQAAADTAGCPLVTAGVTFDGLLEGLDDMLRTSDEPFRDGRFYIHYLLCRLMAEHGVTLSLEGHGSDELLGGYDRFFLALFMEQRHKIGNARAFRQALRSLSLRGVSPVAAWLRFADGLLPSPTRSLLRKLAGRQTVKTRWFRFGPGDMPQVKNVFDYYNGCRQSVGRFSIDLLTRVNVPAMMRVVDRDAARFRIESRLPFLDEDLADFCLSLPSEYLLQGGLTKRVLREAMKGVLPESVRMRKDKMGMELPEEVWIHGSGRLRFEELFRDSVRSAGGLVSEAALGIPGNTRPGSTLPWRILIFGRWMDLYKVNPGQE